jgi:cell division protein FtsW
MKYRFVQSKAQKKSRLLTIFSLENLRRGALPDVGLLLCVFGLLVFGWVMVYSASALFAEGRYHDQFFFLKRQILWSCIGLAAFVAAANVPVSFWQSNAKLIYGATLVGLVLVLGLGHEISGAKRWLRFGGIGIQPSELAKVAGVIIISDYLDRRQSRLKDFKKGLLPLLLLMGVLIGLIAVEPDLGTPILISSVFFALLVLGGARWRHFIVLGLVSLPLVVLAVLKVRYRLHRLFAYMDPWSDARGAGYQLVQSLLAMGSGGIFGRGFGSSRIKISNLPDCHTDFVFSILGEELGLIGTLACSGLFLFLSLRGLKISKSAPNHFSKLMAAGISLTIGFQSLINMGVACGLLPTKGMPLPFLSFGGSSLVITLIFVGILAGISRQAPQPIKKTGG